MTGKLIPLTVLLVLVAVAIAMGNHYFPLLPDPVASHFGRDGTPNGWMSKDSFQHLFQGLLALFALVFVGMPYLMAKIPVSLINLPNKGYWLAPERKEASMEFIGAAMLWFGSAVMALLLYMFYQTFRVNTGQAAALEHPVLALVVFFVFVGAWLIVFVGKFARRGSAR